jgi:GNAT superfamily N-acetyltransferase
MFSPFEIGTATVAEMAQVHALICELAAFERMPGAVSISATDLARDHFGAAPAFRLLVARADSQVVGMAIYYPVYSTWEGKSLYLEDLIVAEAHRGKGIGTALFRAVAQEAATTGMARLQWQALHWNEGALRFYARAGATTDGEWVNCRLSGEALRAFM